MRKVFGFLMGFVILLLPICLFANYNNSITVNVNELNVSKQNCFDVISLDGCEYINVVGAPQPRPSGFVIPKARI